MSAELTLTDARELLEFLQAEYWTDLNVQILQASNGRWSMGIERTVSTLVRLVRAVGADWTKVPMPLLGGVYAAVLEVAGVDGPHPSSESGLELIGDYLGQPDVMSQRARRIVVAEAILDHAAELRELAEGR